MTLATSVRHAAHPRTQEKTCWQCGRTFFGGEAVCPHDGTRLVALSLSEDHDPLLGMTLDGRYRLEERLGEGGMGTVYRAHVLEASPTLGADHKVAIKVLKADYLRDENIRRRFMHEARIVSNLEHPNAVRLHDFSQMPDGNFYMVMELLRGESLAERLAYKFLSYREIFEIIPPICEVLDEAHRKGVVHRDLKPENIYITVDEHGQESPKLIDFGVAKQLEANTMTRTGTLWGTPAYMSPEQARGDEIGAAADTYAIGIIVYELICGNLPFHASTQMGYALKHMNEAPRSMLSLPGMTSVPAALDALILRTLQKSPQARPSSMLEFARQLSAIRDACFDEASLARVPAEEVDPVALQDWMRGEPSPDTSAELFPLDVSSKPHRPNTPSTSAPSLPSSFSALDQLEDSIDLPRVQQSQGLAAAPTGLARRARLGALIALSAALVVGGVLTLRALSQDPVVVVSQDQGSTPAASSASSSAAVFASTSSSAWAPEPPSREDDFSPPPTTDQSVEAMGTGAMRAADVVVRARIMTGDQSASAADILRSSNQRRVPSHKRWRPLSEPKTPAQDARPQIKENTAIKNAVQKIF